MSIAFNNFLSGTTIGTADGIPVMRDYQHATRLYVDSSYARVPKYGFIYFVEIDINQDAISDEAWKGSEGYKDIGLLAKKISLPRFRISTDTLNQYNRKTIVQTKLSYEPVSLELHDDNSNLTHNLWVNYYKHYYADGNYGGPNNGRNTVYPTEFGNTKYGVTDYTYGLKYNKTVNFIKSINIYVMHQHNFTQYTLVNPLVTEWAHDDIENETGTKILRNRMSVSYESVIYNYGEIVPGQNPASWVPVFYDQTPSPLLIAGNEQNSTVYTRENSGFDAPGKSRIYGKVNSTQPLSPLAQVAQILAKNYVNRNGLGKSKSVGYNIAGGVLSNVLGSGAGKYADNPTTQNQPGILNLPGGVGINIFKGLNTSVDGKIRANPAAIIFPKK